MARLIGNYIENGTSPKGIGDLRIAPHARTGMDEFAGRARNLQADAFTTFAVF